MGRTLRALRSEEEEIPPESQGSGKTEDRKGLTVFVVEECGYRCWEWRSGLSEQKLREYWAGLPSVAAGFFDPRDLLRGPLREVRVPVSQLWNQPGWVMHLHMDDDSYLRTPQGEVILHAGRAPEA